MNASSAVDTMTDTASDLAHRAQDFATETALPAVNAAASALRPRIAAAAESARPVLEKAAGRAQQTANDTVLPALATAAASLQQTANDTVLPALQSAAGTVAESARGHAQDLWERVAETEQAQELARRANLVASGSKGEAPRRWPLLVAGIGTGVLLGAVLGRRTAPTPPPAAVAPPIPTSDAAEDKAVDETS